MRVNSAAVTGPTMFGLMIWGFFIRFSVPVLGVFYGTSLIADEVEDKTITYLFTRPIPRERRAARQVPGLPGLHDLRRPAVRGHRLAAGRADRRQPGAGFLDLVKDLGLLALGLAVYGAVFALVGAGFKRPLLFGLLFVFGWETIVMALPGYLKRLSVAYYLQGLVPHAMPGDSPVALVQSIFREIPSLSESLFWMVVITVVCLWWAGRTVANKEYVLEQ